MENAGNDERSQIFPTALVSRIRFQLDLSVVDRAIDGLGYAAISQEPWETQPLGLSSDGDCFRW